MADQKLTALTTIPVVDRAADLLYVVDSSAGTSNKVTPNSLLGIVGAPVGDTDTATLTNKTLTSPVISSPTLSGTVIGTYTLGGTPTFPSSVATLTGSQTLTNKILTSPTINTATIVNPTITTDSISEFTSANGVTIDGLNIKDNKLNTNNSVVTANVTDSAITPAKLLTGTGSSWAWQSWTPTLTNWTIGTGGSAGTLAAYIQIGKTVFFRIRSTLGTAGQSVSGSVSFTLPVAPAAEYYNAITEGYLIGKVKFLDALTAVYHGDIQVTNATTALLVVQNASSTYVQQTTTSGTIPFTWGVNDMWFGEGFYEVA